MEPEGIHELTAAYALHALDREEERAFEDHLSRCAHCREELASFQGAAAALAYNVDAPAPPPTLRQRILAEARSERTNVVPLRRRWALPVTGGVAAVAASAALALGVWSASLSQTLESEREARAEQARALAVLSDPDADRIPISGAHGTLVVAPDGRAALVVSRLARAPENKTYEAWVIEDGAPLPAGLFDARGDRAVVALDRRVPSGAVVAVTVEREGGADRPTGEPIFTAKTV